MNNTSEVCTKVIQFETTVGMQHIIRRAHEDKEKPEKACGSVWPAINAYNAADSVGEVYRKNSVSNGKSDSVSLQHHRFEQCLDPMIN